jgi:spore photoproduct lyase
MYYNGNEALTHNKLFNFIVGNRGSGKTFWSKEWAIKDYIKNKNQFVYLRRYKEELKAKSKFFDDINYKFPDIEFKIKGQNILINDEIAGTFMSLSTAKINKSNAYPNVNKIIFDEFILDKGYYHYIPDEVVNFLELYETISRMRIDSETMKEVNPVRVFFLSNAITVSNPYFLYFNMRVNPDKKFQHFKDDLLVELVANRDFIEMKKYLIIGIRKTHHYVPNEKISDYLVPYTSSGCSAMCLYCYLVCNYNKCSYLRLFVNVDEMLNRLIKKSQETVKECTFEIGSNSDLILENQITGNLEKTIEEFGKKGRGFITFPTKFSMVDNLLNLKHNSKTIVRMSVNSQKIITKVEIGTSSLDKRIEAINKLYQAGYKVGILIAPVIFINNWQQLYLELLDKLNNCLDEKLKESLMIEIIFMTYSYVHNVINSEAFPQAPNLYNKELMTGRGRGKYWYKEDYRKEGEIFFRKEINKRFKKANILYIV